jgi:hypothetical protein
MFDPISMAAMSAIPAVIQGVTGLVQSQRSKNILKNLQRPTYAIPEAQTQALNRSKNLASSMNMAGQANVQQRLDQTSANALYDINQNSSSGVEALAALSGVYSNQMGQENQLGLNAAQDYERRQAMVGNELNKYAGFQDKAWDYNVNQPFQEKAAAAQALGEAGMRNKYEGMKGVVGAGVMGMKMQNANEDNANWLKAFQGNQSSLSADALTQNYSNNGAKASQEFSENLAKTNAATIGGAQGVMDNKTLEGINTALGSVAGKSYDSYGNEMAVNKPVLNPKATTNMTPQQIALFSKLTPEQLALMAKMLNQ